MQVMVILSFILVKPMDMIMCRLRASGPDDRRPVSRLRR